jgi:glycosyltransferase involved in cell wall biosynthesis
MLQERNDGRSPLLVLTGPIRSGGGLGGFGMIALSALVCVHNEEARLAECLARLAFCDEIVVVADRCTDLSETIAREMGAHVVSGAFPLEGPRKQAGIDACRGRWIIEIDADEEVGPALAREIRAAIEREPAGDYFQVPVDNYVGQRLVRHGWGGSFGTSSVARLYRRGVKHWKDQRVHPGVTFTGTLAGALSTPIKHVVDDDIADMVARLNRYTDLRALDLADNGGKMGVWDNVFRGLRRFAKCYWGRKGSTEGELGLLISLMAGLYPVISALKAREILLQRARAPQAPSADLVALRPRLPAPADKDRVAA